MRILKWAAVNLVTAITGLFTDQQGAVVGIVVGGLGAALGALAGGDLRTPTAAQR